MVAETIGAGVFVDTGSGISNAGDGGIVVLGWSGGFRRPVDFAIGAGPAFCLCDLSCGAFSADELYEQSREVRLTGGFTDYLPECLEGHVLIRARRRVVRRTSLSHARSGQPKR